MSETEPEEKDAQKKSSKIPLILGLVFAIVGAAGGFYVTWSGMILSTNENFEKVEDEKAPKSESLDIAYVAVDPLVISLRGGTASRHLKFRAQLEVPIEAEAEVSKILPRVVDVLNSYLRALEPADLEDSAALARLRAQMLRRVQVVAGADNVNDLLIMEFVLT